MNFYQLKSFLAVARNRSFSRASEEVHLTQPCVSKQIQALEDSLGLRLFHRIGRAVALTEAGEILLHYTQRALQELEEAREEIEGLKGLLRGHLLVGAASTIGIYMLPRVLGLYKKRYPEVEIRLDITNKEEVIRRLVNNEIDFGFVGSPVTPPGLETEVYLRDELVLIVAPTHRLAAEESVAAKALAEEVFILREKGSGTREIMEEELKRHGVALRKAMELGSTEAIKQAVAANLGVSIVSRYAINLEALAGRLCAVTVSDLNLTRQLFLVSHQRRALTPAARAFRDLVRKVLTGDEKEVSAPI